MTLSDIHSGEALRKLLQNRWLIWLVNSLLVLWLVWLIANVALPYFRPAAEPELIAISPQEAVNLTYLIDSGVEISLALRSAGDSTVIDTETATMQFFLDDYSIPLPAKLPYGLAPRVDKVPNPGDSVGEPEATP